MMLFKDLIANQPEIGKVVIDTDIFGIERSIKVVHKDGEVNTYPGCDIKDLNFYVEICDNEAKKEVFKKTYYNSDNIQKIEVYERDKEFRPTIYKIFLEDGRSFVYNSNKPSIGDVISDDASTLGKYIMSSLLQRFNTDSSNLVECLKKNPVKKNLNSRDNPINSFIDKHTNIKNKRIREDSKIIPYEKYNKIDIVSFNDLGYPSSIVVYYSSVKSIMVHDEYVCNKYLRSALLRGIDKCSYYPESGVTRVANITAITDRFDEKMDLKKIKINNIFAIFSKVKKLKK